MMYTLISTFAIIPPEHRLLKKERLRLTLTVMEVKTWAETIRLAADTIRIRNDKHLNDLRFQNQEFWFSTTK